jgi:UDP-N-acetylmuramate dehydrogenase
MGLPGPTFDPAALAAALADAGVPARAAEPMARRGWWRVGGPAAVWAEPEDLEQLRRAQALARAHAAPVHPVGAGSNLLVADAGVRGLVLRLGGRLRELDVADGPGGRPLAEVGAGLPDTVLLARLDKLGLGGLGCLAGVPGTVGGAIRMNAGTHLGEIGPRVHEVELLLPEGDLVRVAGSDLGFRYRHAALPEGAVVTRAWLWLSAEGVDAERAAVAAHLARRRATQPLDLPSCGSTFTNPPGDAAGRLIEAAGLKGRRLGGAQVSELHANFFVNRGGATAAELLALIRLARDEVWARFGVALHPEVHLLGAWPDGAWPLPPPGPRPEPAHVQP